MQYEQNPMNAYGVRYVRGTNSNRVVLRFDQTLKFMRLDLPTPIFHIGVRNWRLMSLSKHPIHVDVDILLLILILAIIVYIYIYTLSLTCIYICMLILVITK